MAKVTFVRTSPLAAYQVAVGVGPEEAEQLGLVAVEADGFGLPTAFGKYDEAPPPEEK